MQGPTRKRMSHILDVRDVAEGQIYRWDTIGTRLKPINPGESWHPDFRTKTQITQKAMKATGRAPSTADKFHLWDDVASEFKWISATHILAKQLSDYTTLSGGESCFSFDTENAIAGADDTYLFEISNNGSLVVSVSTNDHMKFENLKELRFGANKLSIVHDGSYNRIESNIRTGGGDAVAGGDVGFTFVHDWNGAIVDGNVETEAHVSHIDFAIVDSLSSEYKFATIYASGRANSGLGSDTPGLIFTDNQTGTPPWDQGWSLGGIGNSTLKFSGMMKRNTTSVMEFFCEDVLGLNLTTSGISFGGSSRSTIRSAAAGLSVRWEPSVLDSPTAPWWEFRNRFDVDTPLGGSRFVYFNHQRSTGDQGLFTIWPASPATGSATYGVGVHANGVITLDDSGTTQGDSHLRYDSVDSRVELTVDGTLAAVWPGRIVTIDRYTANQTLTAANHTVFGNTDGGAFTVTLPVGVAGTEYRIVNTGTAGNSLAIAPNGAESLLGQNTNFTLYDGEALVVAFDSTEGWF